MIIIPERSGFIAKVSFKHPCNQISVLQASYGSCRSLHGSIARNLLQFVAGGSAQGGVGVNGTGSSPPGEDFFRRILSHDRAQCA